MFRKFITPVAVTSVLLAATGMATAADRTEVVHFKSGASSATLSGHFKGYDVVKYVLDARKGQMIHILFSANNGACYFNFISPGESSADFMGETSGNEMSMRLRKSGKHHAEVYMMRSAARRNETCKYSISFEITG